MPKFLVELTLDGYESEAEEIQACEEFILEQLDMTASTVKVKELTANDLAKLES